MTAPATSLEALVDMLPIGGGAYIDRDWFTAAAPPTVPSAVVFDPKAGLRWAGGSPYSLSSDDPDTIAWRMLDTPPASVAGALAGCGPTLVAGHGLVALAHPCAPHPSRERRDLANGERAPVAVVDAMGQAAGLAVACSAGRGPGNRRARSSTAGRHPCIRPVLSNPSAGPADRRRARSGQDRGDRGPHDREPLRDLDPPSSLKPSDSLDSSSSWFVVRADWPSRRSPYGEPNVRVCGYRPCGH